MPAKRIPIMLLYVVLQVQVVPLIFSCSQPTAREIIDRGWALTRSGRFKEAGDLVLEAAREAYNRGDYQNAIHLYYNSLLMYLRGGYLQESFNILDEVFGSEWPANEIPEKYSFIGLIKMSMVNYLKLGDFGKARELAEVLDRALREGRLSYGVVDFKFTPGEEETRVLLLYLGDYYWWVGDEAKACEYWSRAAEVYEEGVRRAWRNVWKAAYALALYEYCGMQSEAKNLARDFTSRFHKRIWKITYKDPLEYYDEIATYVMFQLYLGNTSEAMRAGALLIKTLTEEGYYYEAFEILTLLGTFNKTLTEIGEKAIKDLETDLEEGRYPSGLITWPYLRLAIAGMYLRKPEFKKYAEKAYKVRMAASNNIVFHSIVLLYWLSAGDVNRALEVWDKAGRVLSAWWVAGCWVSPPLNTSWVESFIEEMASANKTIAKGEEAISTLSGEAKARARELLEEAKRLYGEYRFREAEAKAMEAIKLAEREKRETVMLALAAVVAAVAVVVVVTWLRRAKASTESRASR